MVKSCFEDLHTFLSMQGDISSSEVTTEETELKNFRAVLLRDFTVKETFQRHFSIGIYVDINL